MYLTDTRDFFPTFHPLWSCEEWPLSALLSGWQGQVWPCVPASVPIWWEIEMYQQQQLHKWCYDQAYIHESVTEMLRTIIDGSVITRGGGLWSPLDRLHWQPEMVLCGLLLIGCTGRNLKLLLDMNTLLRQHQKLALLLMSVNPRVQKAYTYFIILPRTWSVLSSVLLDYTSGLSHCRLNIGVDMLGGWE